MATKRVFYIPNGPKNLATFFPGIDFDDIAEYWIEVFDDADQVVASTTINKLGGECCADKVRLYFLQHGGAVDAINFKQYVRAHKSVSGTFQAGTKYPLVKSKHAATRLGVKANNIMTLSVLDYGEGDMEWLSEMLHSPLTWINWEGEQSQDDDYIPVVIEDIEIQTIKQEDRYVYEVIIQVRFSHEKYIIRN